jgi:hypothetical protein
LANAIYLKPLEDFTHGATPILVPRPDCTPVDGFGGRICGGILARQIKHDDLFDNLSFCLEEQFKINAQDAYYIKRVMESLDRANTAQGGYVPPGRGDTWDLEWKIS